MTVSNWATALRHQIDRRFLDQLVQLDAARPLPWQLPEPLMPTLDWGFVRLNDIPLPGRHLTDTHLFDFQSVLSAVSTLSTLQHGFRLVFLLTGEDGRYALHLGVAREQRGAGVPQELVLDQMSAIVRSHLTGLRTAVLDRLQRDELLDTLTGLSHASAITGIPTLRTGAERYLVQSLDRFASQLRHQKFALVIIADPLSEPVLTLTYDRVLRLISEVHPHVSSTGPGLPGTPQERLSALTSESALVRLLASTSYLDEQTRMGLSLAVQGGFKPEALMHLRHMTRQVGQVLANSPIPKSALAGTAILAALTDVQREHLNRHAQEIERHLEHHADRLRQGQNLGMWEVGVYLLSDSETTDQLGASLLRSVGSGAETFLEPIRVQHLGGLRRPQKPRTAVQLLQFPSLEPGAFGLKTPHPLGENYQRLTTVLNTAELSIWMSLPQRDLPGISALPRPPHFATDFQAPREGVTVGKLMDGGEVLGHDLGVELKDLTRHLFITGLTGSGKSTTSRALLQQLLERQTPLLIVEPAKTEYLEWGLRLREQGVPVRLYSPGRTSHQGQPLDPLALNPFEVPGGYEVLSHIDRVKAILTAAFPMQEVLPILLESALFRMYEEQGWLDEDRLADLPPPRLSDLEESVVRTLNDRDGGYAEEVRRNLQTAMLHRLRSLRQGFKGRLFDQPRSTPLADLFDQVTVVNLSTLSADTDKSLVMGLLLGLLYEYRTVQGPVDGLRHVTMVEEAHRILRAPRGDPSSPEAYTAEAFADLLAEVRAYGEGLIIVDQVPAKLIPDALKNTYVKVVHRLQARDDQEALAAAMGLTPEQLAVIPLLRQGQAIVQAGPRSALVQVPAPVEGR